MKVLEGLVVTNDADLLKQQKITKRWIWIMTLFYNWTFGHFKCQNVQPDTKHN